MNLNAEDEMIFSEYISDIDSYMADSIENHKIQLLFIKHINDLACADCIDKRIYEKFSNKLFYIQHKYEEHLEYLNRIVTSSEMQTVKHAVLKGFAITYDLYKNNGIIYRPFSDVDILVDRRDAQVVDKALKEIGFVQGKIKGGKIILADRKDIIRNSLNMHQLHEYICLSKHSNLSSIYHVEFDINTSIFEGGMKRDPIDTSELLNHRMRRKVADDFEVYSLDYIYCLIQLCYHFYKDTVYDKKKKTHDDYCLLKFCDIREYVLQYKGKIDWKEFVRVVNEAQIGNQIFYPLWLVSSFYGDLEIEDILYQLKDKRYQITDIDWEKILL